MDLSQDKQVEVFKTLTYLSAYETGVKFGFDKHYKDTQSVRNAVTNIYRKMKDNPARFGISPEVRSMVVDAMAARALIRISNNIPKAEKEIETDDIKAIVTGVRDKAWKLMDRKLQRASKSNMKLDNIGLSQLATLAGIAFDKAQIISGQATEHIALMGKIEGNINPQDALDMVLKMREAVVASKNK